MQLEPHHVGIDVADMDRSIAFYEALGFERTSLRTGEGDAPSIAFMRLGSLSIELFAYDPPLPAVERPRRSLGFRHLALRCEDIDTTVADLKAAGIVPRDDEIRTLPIGIRLLFFTDPDGMELELLQEAGS